MAKLPQQLQAVQLYKSQRQPIRCDFCGGDNPNGHCSYQNNSSGVEVNYMGNQEGKVVSPTTIIILKVGEAIRIKILGGTNIVVHPTSKVLSNNNNNPYILQLLKD